MPFGSFGPTTNLVRNAGLRTAVRDGGNMILANEDDSI